MGPALVVAGKDLRQRLRDRTAYIVGLVAPLVLAGLISLAFGRSGIQFKATFAVVDQDGGPLARAFLGEGLAGADVGGATTLRMVGGRDEAVRLARAGDVAAAIVVPAGYSQAALAGQPLPIEVVRSADKRIGADVAVAIAHGFTAKVNAVRLSVVTAMAGGDPGAGFEQLAADAAHLGPSVILDERSAERADVPAASRYAPGMGIFFMFTAMVLTLARSEQQAQLYMSVATLGMAMLGGNFIDVERGPELLRRLSLITPNGWALRAFRDLNVDRGGLGSITTHVSAILAFALVTFAIAAVRSRRLVRL